MNKLDSKTKDVLAKGNIVTVRFSRQDRERLQFIRNNTDEVMTTSSIVRWALRLLASKLGTRC